MVSQNSSKCLQPRCTVLYKYHQFRFSDPDILKSRQSIFHTVRRTLSNVEPYSCFIHVQSTHFFFPSSSSFVLLTTSSSFSLTSSTLSFPQFHTSHI